MNRLLISMTSEGFFHRKWLWFTRLLPLMVMLGCVFEPEAGPVVAVVGDRHVTALAFKKELAYAREDLPLSPASEDWLMGHLVDQVIDRWLVLEYARRNNVVISKAELVEHIKELKAGYSKKEFQAALIRSHMTPAMWEKRLFEDLLIQKVTQKVSQSIAPPSYEEMKVYFETHKREFMMPEMVKFRQIVCENKTIANELRKRALAGENLGKLAAQHSLAPESNQDVEAEWIPKGYMDEGLERAVFSLKPGQISPAVRGPSGYHIFEVLSRRDSGMQEYGKVVQEIERRIIEQKKADLYREWLKKLRAEIPIRINREALDKMELS